MMYKFSVMCSFKHFVIIHSSWWLTCVLDISLDLPEKSMYARYLKHAINIMTKKKKENVYDKSQERRYQIMITEWYTNFHWCATKLLVIIYSPWWLTCVLNISLHSLEETLKRISIWHVDFWLLYFVFKTCV